MQFYNGQHRYYCGVSDVATSQLGRCRLLWRRQEIWKQ